METKKIGYRDLSFWMKVGIVGGVMSLIVFGIAFLEGFIEGLIKIPF